MRRLSVIAVLSGVFVLSCAMPIYERAQVSRGPSFCIGAGGNVGRGVSDWVFEYGPDVNYFASGMGTACFRYGFSHRFGMFLQGTGGYGDWLTEQGRVFRPPWYFDVQLGTKLKVSQPGALRAGLGIVGLLDVTYLHDFCRGMTGSFGLGFRGAHLGLTGHVPLSRKVRGYASLSAVTGWEHVFNWKPDHIPAATFGLGLEWHRPGQ